MKQLIAKDKRSLLPSILSDFFDTEDFFPSGLLDRNGGAVFPFYGVDKMPSANIMEREKDFLIELAVPGLDKKDFKVEVEHDMLVISAEKEEKREEEKNGMTRKEFSFNKFCRSFRLPANTKVEKVEASYKDGILKIEIPKKTATEPKANKAIAVK